MACELILYRPFGTNVILKALQSRDASATCACYNFLNIYPYPLITTHVRLEGRAQIVCDCVVKRVAFLSRRVTQACIVY